MPENEVEICLRLGQLRNVLRLSRVVFAKDVGVDSGFLSNLEHQKARLKFGLGNTICQKFNINQRWLALGKMPFRGYVQPEKNILKSINPNDLFSEVYNTFLSTAIDQKLKVLAEMMKCKEEKLDEVLNKEDQTDSNAAFTIAVLKIISSDYGKLIESLPVHLQKRLIGNISGTIATFLKSHAKKISQIQVAKLSIDMWR